LGEQFPSGLPSNSGRVVENSPRQGRKAATARVRGLSVLPSLAPSGVDRLLPFFTSFSFIPRFYLDFLTPELCSETPSAIRCFADGRRRANTNRQKCTKRCGNSPCQLRPIPASGGKPPDCASYHW